MWSLGGHNPFYAGCETVCLRVPQEFSFVKRPQGGGFLVSVDFLPLHYSNFTDEQTKELLEFCKENKLYTSGGTDFHGTKRPAVQVGIGKGNLKIPDDIIKSWCKI